MKKILTLALVLALGSSCLMAKKVKKFEGIISYSVEMSGDPSITSSMDMLPAGMLTAVFKTKGQYSMMSIMGQKTFLDAKKGIITSLIDMSMLGMGSYCMENPYDAGTQDQQKNVFTGETKTICGYKAEKIKMGETDGTAIEVWVTREIAIEAGVPMLIGLEGFIPLQFDIQSNASGLGEIKITLTAKEIKQQKVPTDDLVPPKDCQKIKPEELNTMLQQIQNFGSDFEE
ncbi:MAG: hypothetical protein J5605_04050 [Bacteroidales bacterium]|jgi:hypothetical protein|nr:hypothetical protein [Bacteroidales bacterium]